MGTKKTSVWLAANTLAHSELGGHLWVYLNWALGLLACGCEVTWLEMIRPGMEAERARAAVALLKRRLEPFGLADHVALCSQRDEPLPWAIGEACRSHEEAGEADLLLSMVYALPHETVRRFRRSALLDIDPGLLQVWMSHTQLPVAPHDVYFTIGETVGRPASPIPDCGIAWNYTPPVVFLPIWPVSRTYSSCTYTTVSNWWGGEWVVFGADSFNNDKRITFLEYAGLPSRTPVQLELALCMGPGDEEEQQLMEREGWRIRPAAEVTATPEQYQSYIQRSRGEFSCAKPSCMRLQNAWISDRTICYLASGKPAIVQHTGPSRFLPDAEGLFRFRSLEEAARALEAAEADYERHSQAARELVEEYFSAEKVVSHVLERALT